MPISISTNSESRVLPPRRPRNAGALLVVAALMVGLVSCSTSASSDSGATSTTLAPLGPGTQWSASLRTVALPPAFDALTSVSCLPKMVCLAVGTSTTTQPVIARTTNAGLAWTAPSVPASLGLLSSVSCSGTDHCVMAGQSGVPGAGSGVLFYSSDGGRLWNPSRVSATVSDVSAVSCRGSDCLAIATATGGLVALRSTDGGAGWSQAGALPANLVEATSVSCPGTLRCLVTAQQRADATHAYGVVVTTANGGTSWSIGRMPTGTGTLFGISCPTTNWCTAVGSTSTLLTGSPSGAGTALVTTNGQTWSRQLDDSSSTALLAVACVAPDTCLATGTTPATNKTAAGLVLATGTPGHTWSSPVPSASPTAFDALACPEVNVCALVGPGASGSLVASS